MFTQPCLTAENEAVFGPEPDRVDATPEAFLAHLAAHPFLTLTEPVAVEISGLQVDVTTNVHDDCDPPWAWLWVLPVVERLPPDRGCRGTRPGLGSRRRRRRPVAEVGVDGDTAALTDPAMSVFGSIRFDAPG